MTCQMNIRHMRISNKIKQTVMRRRFLPLVQPRIREQYLNDPLTAMDLYQKLLKEHPDSLHASAARKQYKELRTKTGLTPGIN